MVIEIFDHRLDIDAEIKFKGWMRDRNNWNKCVLNATLSGKPERLHRASCESLIQPGKSMTKSYIKVCGTKEEIMDWVKENCPEARVLICDQKMCNP